MSVKRPCLSAVRREPVRPQPLAALTAPALRRVAGIMTDIDDTLTARAGSTRRRTRRCSRFAPPRCR